MAKYLPADATIASVAEMMSDQDKYISRAYGNVHKLHKSAAPGSVRVRIGILGIGDTPHYRIETLDCNGSQVGDPSTFRGDNHQELFKDNAGLAERHWSSATMTYEELRHLLGSIRSFPVAR